MEIGQDAFVRYAACMRVGSIVWVCLNPTAWRDLFLFVTGEFSVPSDQKWSANFMWHRLGKSRARIK